jgi:hypothetical protein
VRIVLKMDIDIYKIIKFISIYHMLSKTRGCRKKNKRTKIKKGKRKALINLKPERKKEIFGNLEIIGKNGDL